MRCVIIAGSPDVDIEFISATVCENDYVICADKGFEYAQKAGVKPDLVVGDFDSYNKNCFENYETIRLDSHKDDTDTMHSIDIALERGYKNILILGAIGGRFDHTFANVSALQYINNKGAKGLLLSKSERIEFLSQGEYCYDGYNGKTFSLFPFGCSQTAVTYSNVEYPLDNYSLKSSIPMGVSNVFTSDKSVVKINDGNAIFIINLSRK